MYSEVALVLVSSRTQVQAEITFGTIFPFLMTMLLLNLKLALGITLTIFLVLFYLLGMLMFRHISIFQKNIFFYKHKQNISFLYLICTKHLTNSFDSFDKKLNVKSVYLYLSMLYF